MSQEHVLFAMLAKSHLESSGTVGFRGHKWTRDESIDGYTRLNDKEEVTSSWKDANNVIEDLLITIKRERKNLNDVYFFFMDPSFSGHEGVTWRMLKIDMSFLRIVLEHDHFTMQEIIRRFVRISEDTHQNGPEEPFQNLN